MLSILSLFSIEIRSFESVRHCFQCQCSSPRSSVEHLSQELSSARYNPIKGNWFSASTKTTNVFISLAVCWQEEKKKKKWSIDAPHRRDESRVHCSYLITSESMAMLMLVETKNIIESFTKLNVKKGIKQRINGWIQPEEPESDLVDNRRNAFVLLGAESTDQSEKCVRTPADDESEDQNEEFLRCFPVSSERWGCCRWFRIHLTRIELGDSLFAVWQEFNRGIIRRFHLHVITTNESVGTLPDVQVDEQIQGGQTEEGNEKLDEGSGDEIGEVLRKGRTAVPMIVRFTSR